MPPTTAEKRRETILDAALKIVSAHGTEALTMRDIAHRTGLSRPALYQYFASREHILGELLINELADLGNEADRLLAQFSDAREQVRVWVHYSLGYATFAQRRLDGALVMDRVPPEMRGELTAMRDLLLKSLVGALKEIGVSEPATHAHLVAAAVRAAAQRVVTGACFTMAAQVLEQFVMAGVEAAALPRQHDRESQR